MNNSAENPVAAEINKSLLCHRNFEKPIKAKHFLQIEAAIMPKIAMAIIEGKYIPKRLISCGKEKVIFLLLSSILKN